MMSHINVSGAAEFRKGLMKLPRKLQTKALKGTEQTAGFVRNHAKIYAETGMNGPGTGIGLTGELGNGIISKRTGKISYSVISQSLKSPLYENGFKSHFVSVKRHPELMDWINRKAPNVKLFKGKYLWVRGNAWNKREFMTRAFWDGKKRYPRIMADAVAKSISESFGGA